ncbi:MAG: hypothetical protein WCV88_06175 [Patescibacteria group bacterium]|jgi:hypothetical protein
MLDDKILIESRELGLTLRQIGEAQQPPVTRQRISQKLRKLGFKGRLPRKEYYGKPNA